MLKCLIGYDGHATSSKNKDLTLPYPDLSKFKIYR